MTESAAGTPTAAEPSPEVLLVAGHLDDPGAERLQALLADAMTPGEDLTLDLSQVTRLTYPALEALVAASRRLQDGGGRLLLSRPSVPVVRALRISGLDRVLPVLPSVPVQRVVGS